MTTTTTPQVNNSKGRKIAAWVLTGLLGALFLFSGFMKIMASEEVSANFVKYGLSGRELLIGTGELLSAILFIYPRTSSLGVLLLTAHIGGAISTHMGHNEPFLVAALFLPLIWLAGWLRNPEMFSSFRK